MAGTFVEFFSEEALENVMVMLKYKPERILYIGHKHNMITKKINSLKNFAARVSPETELVFIEVSRDDLDQIIRTLDDICEKYPDCQFELTGGGELILIAFGFVSAKRKLKTTRIDPFTSTEINDFEGVLVRKNNEIQMTVADNMVLHGGALTNQTGSISTWHFDDDFRSDVVSIWEIACRFRHKWNRYCSSIEEAMKNGECDETGLYSLSKRSLNDAIELFYALYDIHAITNLSSTQRYIRFRFKNDSIRKIITKTGNILELHVYEVATRAPYLFQDAVIGAVIDWDGKLPDPETRETVKSFDTINEIDVILMRDVIPTFISCKSGKAGSNALHELQTVTRRFGGKYAKKVLIMASPCDVSASGASFFKQRAKDMHIWVIDNVFAMSDDALLSRLKKIQGP